MRWVEKSAFGGPGNDRLTATNGPDQLLSGAGNDDIDGLLGPDQILYPNSTNSMRTRKMKKGSWPPVGSGPPSAGGQMMGPSIMAGAVTTTVTIRTFT